MKKQIAKNTIYQILAKTFSVFGMFFVTMLITRTYGAYAFGQFSVALTYVTVFYLFTDLGMDLTFVKEIAHSESTPKNQPKNPRQLICSLFSFRMLSGTIVSVIAILLLFVVPYSYNVKRMIGIILPLIWLRSVYSFAQAVFQIRKNYLPHFVAMSISTVAGVSLTYIAVRMHAPILYVMFGVLASNLFLMLIGSVFVLHFVSIRFFFDISRWITLLQKAVPIGVSLVLNLIMVQTDRILLSLMSTEVSLGYYNLAYKLFDIVLLLPFFLLSSMYPILITLYRDSLPVFKKHFKQVLVLLVVSGIVLTIIAIPLSKHVIPYIWGIHMVNSILPFNILMFGSTLFFLSSGLSWGLIITDNQRTLAKVYGLACLFNFVFNIVFIPYYDYIAAASITVLTELLVLIYLVYKSKVVFFR